MIECTGSVRPTIRNRSKELWIFGSKVYNPSIKDYTISDVLSEKFMLPVLEKLGPNGLVTVRQLIKPFACAFFTLMPVNVYC